jgi:hypothetical protein
VLCLYNGAGELQAGGEGAASGIVKGVTILF